MRQMEHVGPSAGAAGVAAGDAATGAAGVAAGDAATGAAGVAAGDVTGAATGAAGVACLGGCLCLSLSGRRCCGSRV